MGRIEYCERELTHQEEEQYKKIAKKRFFKADLRPLQTATVLEFYLIIDRITKPENVLHLPDPILLYLFELGSNLKICYELCFMDRCTVIGTFPANQIKVAFVVQNSETNDWQDVTPGRWAISYNWIGSPAEIIDVPYDFDADELVPIYRLSNMLDAANNFQP